MQTAGSTLRQIPQGIWVLGFVSLLMDVSSEMIHSLLPLFMVSSLGMGALSVGILEGIAESTALIIKVFSGSLSDYLGKRKSLAVAGYTLGAISKPLFALATGAGLIFSARILDRIGKGIRGAPRDALVADITPPHLRGAAFGLRQSLDTVGAFTGPLLAMLLMFAFANNFRVIFWLAFLPALAAVLLLLFGLREPAPQHTGPRINPLQKQHIKRLGRHFWWVSGLGALFCLARFSEAFLVLRAGQSGMNYALVPLVMVAMNVVYALCAYPFGQLSDRVSQTGLLAAGLGVLLAADLLLASSSHWAVLLPGVALWGIHMGMTQGLLATLVANVAPADLRGTAFGIFNLISGVSMLLASVMAGFIWQTLGADYTFYGGAACCLLCLLYLMNMSGKKA